MSSADAIDLFLGAAADRPGETAVSLRTQGLSYAGFEGRVRQFAAALLRAPGAAVLIALPAGADAYAAMLGAGLAGAFYSPVNAAIPVEKLLRIVHVMQPNAIVAEGALLRTLASEAPQALALEPGALPSARLSGTGTRHEIGYLIFTSGTTGVPKGVVIPRNALNHYLDWVRRSGTVRRGDRVGQFASLGFDISLTDIYGALCTGATLCPAIGQFDRTFPARLIARERLTVWNSTPSVIGLMMQAGDVKPSLLKSLRLINACGEPLLPMHLSVLFSALPDVIVQNTYGPTETTVSVTELPLTRSDHAAACAHTVAIGRPIDDMGIHLVGGTHADEGEIVITGPQLAQGYWQDAAKTAAAFRKLELDGRCERAYFTGDWAERRDGYLFFKHRIDQQVKIHGHRLELDEVAHALHAAGFPTVCVLLWEGQLTAVIEQAHQLQFDAVALRDRLARQLETHAIPTRMHLIDRIPRTSSDKLDRTAVQRWLAAQTAEPVG